MIHIDSREKSDILKGSADEVRLLRYNGALGEAWSYDIEVVTKAGQVLTFERKAGLDLVSSFDKLERQLSPVDGLIVEGWNEKAWLLSERGEDSRFVHLLESTKKRVWRLSMSKAVLYTKDVHETLALLRYFESREESIEVRGPAFVN